MSASREPGAGHEATARGATVLDPQVTGLRTLTLRSVGMPDLSALTTMADLRGLGLKLNGTRDLSLLPAFTRLQYFEAWLVRGLSDLRPIAETTSLEELDLSSMSHLDPAQVLQLAAHPVLRRASIGLGSDRKNAAAALPLPHIDTPSLYQSLKAAR